jgi:hypothetical protein
MLEVIFLFYKFLSLSWRRLPSRANDARLSVAPNKFVQSKRMLYGYDK